MAGRSDDVPVRSWIWAKDRLWRRDAPYDATEKSVIFAIVSAMGPNHETGQTDCFMRHSVIAELAGCSVATVKRVLVRHMKRGGAALIQPSSPGAVSHTKGYRHSCLRYTLRIDAAQIELAGRELAQSEPSQGARAQRNVSEDAAQVERQNSVLQPGSGNSSTDTHTARAPERFTKLLAGYPRASTPRVQHLAWAAFLDLLRSTEDADGELRLMFGDFERLKRMRKESIEPLHVWISKRRWRRNVETMSIGRLIAEEERGR